MNRFFHIAFLVVLALACALGLAIIIPLALGGNKEAVTVAPVVCAVLIVALVDLARGTR